MSGKDERLCRLLRAAKFGNGPDGHSEQEDSCPGRLVTIDSTLARTISAELIWESSARRPPCHCLLSRPFQLTTRIIPHANPWPSSASGVDSREELTRRRTTGKPCSQASTLLVR